MGSMPLTERQTSPSELSPDNLDLSSFNGSYRMWRRLVHSTYLLMINAVMLYLGFKKADFCGFCIGIGKVIC